MGTTAWVGEAWRSWIQLGIKLVRGEGVSAWSISKEYTNLQTSLRHTPTKQVVCAMVQGYNPGAVNWFAHGTIPRHPSGGAAETSSTSQVVSDIYPALCCSFKNHGKLCGIWYRCDCQAQQMWTGTWQAGSHVHAPCVPVRLGRQIKTHSSDRRKFNHPRAYAAKLKSRSKIKWNWEYISKCNWVSKIRGEGVSETNPGKFAEC